MFSQTYFITCVCIALVLCLKDLQTNRGYKKCPRMKELLNKNDLTKYLEALNRIIDFSGDHENVIDINLYFGLFLANVNLKRALGDKYEVVSVILRSDIKEIINKIEQLLDFYKYTIEKDAELRNNKYRIILSLFENGTSWTHNIPKFYTTCLSERKSFFNLEKVDLKWMLYKKYIDDRNAWLPNPHQSDLCLTSLASAEVITKGNSGRCRILKFCYDMLRNGTDFGYALAHRLLLLQQSAFGRSCNIFSEQEDIQLSHRFCNLAYQEAKYIAMHNFEIVDLLLEHVCLCALNGNAVFLKRSWLKNVLNFQTADGCFSHINKTYKRAAWLEEASWKVAQSSDRAILDGYCNGHTTALAAGTLAMAVRFILQFYY